MVNLQCIIWNCCAGRSWFAGRSGAQRNEESANREGVASGSVTTKTSIINLIQHLHGVLQHLFVSAIGINFLIQSF